MVLASCGGGGGGSGHPTDPPIVAQGDTEARAQVGGEGGTLVLAGGSAIVVPQSALSGMAELAVSTTAGLPADAPVGPNGLAPLGDVLTTTPHGQSFAATVEIRFAMPAGVGSERLTLFTQSGDGSSAWQPVPGVSFDQTTRVATVTTTHFSHWAWFELPSDVPAAIPSTAMLDTAAGWAYWTRWRQTDHRYEIRRARLTPGATWQVIYEEPTPDAWLRIVARGPGTLFFLREGTGKLARIGVDGTGLVADWGDVSGLEAGSIIDGFTTATHLYVTYRGDGGALRFALATGVGQRVSFTLGGKCALSADETKVGCGSREVDLTSAAAIYPKYMAAAMPSGWVLTDGTHWYFTEMFVARRVYKVAYGSSDAQELTTESVEAATAAIHGTTLFLGEESGRIVAIDTVTGAVKSTFTTAPDSVPNALLAVDDDYVYYGVNGGSMQRRRLADFGP